MEKIPKTNDPMRTWMIVVPTVLLSPGFILASLELVRMMFNLARYSN
jgi:hypothetical protein